MESMVNEQPEPGEITPERFAELSVSHMSALGRAARRLTGDPGAAEDLVQETYLRALRSRHSFRLREFGMRPWLLRIQRNLYLTNRASDARRPVALSREHLEGVRSVAGRAAPGLPEGLPPPAGLDGMDEELASAVRDLPPAHRSVLLLWAVDGLTYAEVAAALNSPPGTVMSRLHRARGRLSRRLHGFAIRQGFLGRRREAAVSAA